MVDGIITSITLDRDPAGIKFYQEGSYLYSPTITLSDEEGTGATAFATIYSPSDAALKPEHTASKESFLQILQEERMREFNFEGVRKADLLRWGVFMEVMGNMGNTVQQDAPGAFYAAYYSNVTSKNLLSPIPVSETNVNEAMVQNPGWD